MVPFPLLVMSESENLWALITIALILLTSIFLLYARSATAALEAREAAWEAALLKALAARVAAARARRQQGLTAIVTGANAGLGLSLSCALARAGVRVVLACRDEGRGRDALAAVLAAAEAADAERGGSAVLVRLDVSCPASVLSCAAKLASDEALLGRAKHVDFLFCNAGVMPVAATSVAVLAQALVSGELSRFLETGRAASSGAHFLQQGIDEVGACGAPQVFATHVLGHALLVDLLAAAGMLDGVLSPRPRGGGPTFALTAVCGGSAVAAFAAAAAATSKPLLRRARSPLSTKSHAARCARAAFFPQSSAVAASPTSMPADLGATSRAGRVIWVSSRAASAKFLDWEYLAPPDCPGEESPFQRLWLTGLRPPMSESYGVAKYAMDLLVAAAGRRLPYVCVAVCPGALGTGLVPAAARAALPLLGGLRAFLPGFNITPERGVHALLACAVAPAEELRADTKYVAWNGALVPATLSRGAELLPLDDQERLLALVSAWLSLWRAAGAAALATRTD